MALLFGKSPCFIWPVEYAIVMRDTCPSPSVYEYGSLGPGREMKIVNLLQRKLLQAKHLPFQKDRLAVQLDSPFNGQTVFPKINSVCANSDRGKGQMSCVKYEPIWRRIRLGRGFKINLTLKTNHGSTLNRPASL